MLSSTVLSVSVLSSLELPGQSQIHFPLKSLGTNTHNPMLLSSAHRPWWSELPLGPHDGFPLCCPLNENPLLNQNWVLNQDWILCHH